MLRAALMQLAVRSIILKMAEAEVEMQMVMATLRIVGNVKLPSNKKIAAYGNIFSVRGNNCYFLYYRKVMTDSHIHIGQYYNLINTPSNLLSFGDSVGMVRCAVSSTSTCTGNYQQVIDEFKQLFSLYEGRFVPVLWITPKMICTRAVFSMFEQGINWKCLKIHPQLNPTKWGKRSACLDFVASMASVWRIPLLIHTGEMAGCYPFEFDEIISRRSDVTFILAHGRPIGQTVEMMKKYPNVWCDTAFMPTENIVRLCMENLSERVLWGSDYPIPQYYYPDMDMKTYYLDLVKKLKNSVSQEDFEKITHKNFEKLFGE